MNEKRKIAASTFLRRLNEGRNVWLTEAEVIAASKEFLLLNGYSTQTNRTFGSTTSVFESPISGVREADGESRMLATYVHPRLEKYDIALFGSLESSLFSVLDNADNANLALATDSLSYFHILRNEEINVALENLMGVGLYILFLNNRSGHALFDNFRSLTEPIPIEDY